MIKWLLCIGLAFSAYSSNDSTIEFFHHLNPNIHTTYDADSKAIQLSGTKIDVETVVDILGDPARLTEFYVGSQGSSHNHVLVKNTPFENWFEFLERCGVTEEFDMVNFQSKFIQDDTTQGVLSIDTKKDFAKNFANLCLNELQSQSSFFKWLSGKYENFIETSDEKMLIHYGRAQEFLTSETLIIDEQQQDQATVCFSSKWLVNRLIAANSGPFMLKRIAGRQAAELFVIQPESKALQQSRSHTLKMLIDISGSMEGYINEVKEYLPCFVKNIHQKMPEHTSINIEFVLFNTESKIHAFILKKEEEQPDILSVIYAMNPISGTDLRVFQKHLSCEDNNPATVVGFTDGKHQLNSSPVKDQRDMDIMLQDLEDLKVSNKINHPHLYAVGAHADKTLLKNIAEKLGGSFEENQDIDAFIKCVTDNLNTMLKPQSLFHIVLDVANEHSKKVFWVPDEMGLYNTHQNVVEDSVVTEAKSSFSQKFKNMCVIF